MYTYEEDKFFARTVAQLIEMFKNDIYYIDILSH